MPASSKSTLLLSFGLLLVAGALPARSEPEMSMKPKVWIARGGAFQCASAPTLLVGKSLAGAPAIAPLAKRLQDRFGAAVTPGSPAAKLPPAAFILVGLTQDHPSLRKLVGEHESELPKAGLGPEGYVLDVTPERVLVAASKPAGAYYGVLKLLDMDSEPKGFTAPAGVIVDWPTMGWRGMHLLVGSRADMPDLEKMIAETMPHFHLNQLILEINYNFQYKSHPEVGSADGLSREDCRHLKELADRSYVRLVPMINCLGHQSWAQNTAKLLATHPEFDETPDYPADNKGIYCRSWCPNSDVNKVVFDLMDELIDAFDANAFHAGMDEVFILGKCPRCKGTDNARLFAKAVNDIHAHLVGRRKVQMMIWGDRLIDGEATGYGEWEASKNGTYPAIDLIPKDVVLCDWHYETKYAGKPATYPSVHYFQEKGFRVWPSGWNSAENARMIATKSLEKRTDRMVGYLATTWVGVHPVAAALAGEDAGEERKNAAGVAAAIREGSRIAWEGNIVTR